MMDDRGKRLEKYLTSELGHYLLPDFVIANPKIRFGRGKEEELADVIVPFMDSLITMQFKSKKQEEVPSDISQTMVGRILKKITEASDQAKTTLRAHRAGLLKSFYNIRGVRVTLDGNISKITSVIIVQLDGEERFPYFDRTRFIIPYFEKHGISHHVFFSDDLEIALEWLDTVGDLNKYLDIRKEVLSTKRLRFPFYEPDLLSCFLFSYPKLMDGIGSHDKIIAIEPGKYWKDLDSSVKIINKRFEEYAKYGWVVDEIISEIHTILGRNSEDLQSEYSGEITDKSEVYMQLIVRFGSLFRLERYRIGKIFMEKMEKAETSDRGWNYFVYMPNALPRMALVMIATREVEMRKRMECLKLVTISAYYNNDVDEVVGIATDSIDSKTRSFQFIIYRPSERSKEEEKWHRDHSIFKEPTYKSSDVWSDMRSLVDDGPSESAV